MPVAPGQIETEMLSVFLKKIKWELLRYTIR